jgi:hypothetical protein
VQLFSDVQGDEFNVDTMEMSVSTWSNDRPVISNVNNEERKTALKAAQQKQQHDTATTAADTQHTDVPAATQ